MSHFTHYLNDYRIQAYSWDGFNASVFCQMLRMTVYTGEHHVKVGDWIVYDENHKMYFLSNNEFKAKGFVAYAK